MVNNLVNAVMKDAKYFMNKSTFEKFYLALTVIQAIVGLINDESFRFWLLHYLFFTIALAIALRHNNDNNQ